MAVARHDTGLIGDLRALSSQIHPVFMLPPLAASAFGSLLSGRFTVFPGVLHLIAILCAVYTAHIKDGYIDFYYRNEDDDHPLTRQGCHYALIGASLSFFVALFGLSLTAGLRGALFTLPAWLIGYHHAPELDTHPLTTTLGYPTGIALALLSGYYVHRPALSPLVVALAFVILVLLAGVKIIDDAQDFAYDRTIGKRTVAVVLGPRAAIRLAYLLMITAIVGLCGFAVHGTIPLSSAIAGVVFLPIAGVASRARPPLAIKLLIRGAYLVFAVLVAAVWYRPLA